MNTTSISTPRKGNKLLLGLGIVVVLLLITWWLIRNRYKFRSHGDIYKYPYEFIQAMGAKAIKNSDGSTQYEYKTRDNDVYVFYSNNRVGHRDNKGQNPKMGSYNFDEITWDDKTKTSLKSVFA